MTHYKLPKFLILFITIAFLIRARADGQMRQVWLDGSLTSNEIKKMSFYSPSTGYLAMIDQNKSAVAFTTDSGRTLIKRYIRIDNVNFNGYPVNLTFGFYINGVKAFDQNNIIVYGDYGLVPAILYSTDGGLNYTLIYHFQFNPMLPNSSIMDMVFPQNNSVGFAVDADQILKTTDGGHTWIAVRTDAGSKFNYIEAIDNNTLFAISPKSGANKILNTTNGGANWQQLTIPASSYVFYTNFITTSRGWLVVQDSANQLGKVYYTSNGGNNWIQKNNTLATPFLCTKMKFINDSTGFAIAGFTTYQTTDSGKVWEPVPRDNNFSYLGYGYNDMQVIGNTQLWCGGGLQLLEINTSLNGPTLPLAFFDIDTSGIAITRNVSLINYSRKDHSCKWYVNNQLISTSYNASYLHDVYHPTDTIKLIVSNGINTDSLIKYQYCGSIPKPAISFFSPTIGTAGSVITIHGSYFLKTSSISFGSFSATSFNVISDSVVNAVVGDGGSGSVHITTIAGTDSLAGFIYIPPPPVITSISPSSATPGTVITITGNYFNGATAINFGGAAAISFSVISQTEIKAVVGVTSSGNVTVTTPTGTGSIGGFTIIPIVTLNSFSPVSGPVGATVTIIGTNFSATPSNNIVYFGGVMATVTNATSTKLTVKVPAGAVNQPIIVEVNGQIAQSSLSFLPTFNDGEAITSSSFSPSVTYPAIHDFDGYGVLGDLDGDGKLDLVCGKGSVFRNTSILGNISLASRQDFFYMLSSPYTSLLKDMDGDGKLDMVINSIGLKIARNISTVGNIAFDNPISFSISGGGLSVSDIDGDNRPDVAMLGGNSVLLARNTSHNGNLSFENTIQLQAGDNPWDCVFADLDGDNKPEMIIPNYYSGNVGVYHNISIPGRIDFEPPVLIDMGGATWRVAVSDIDGDNKTDLVVAHSSNSNNQTEFISILRNTSAGTGDISFAPAISFTATDPFSLQIADLNGDDKPDVISANQSNQTVSLFENIGTQGNIGFASRVNLTTGGNVYPRYAPVGDMDNDGKPDVVYMNWNINSVTIFRNGSGEHFADAGRDTALCAAGPSVQIGTPAVSGYSYSWTSVPAGFTSTNAMPTVAPSGTTKYYLTVTNPTGIHAIDSTTVTIENLVANAGNDMDLCGGTGTTIGSYPQPGITYDWTSIPAGFSSNEAMPLAFPQGTTQYCLLISSGAGCTAKDTVKLTVTPNSSASVSIDGTITVVTGQSSLITTTPVNEGNSPWYVWQDSTANHDWQNINTTNGPTLNYIPQQTGDKLRCLMSTSKPCASPGTFTSNTLQFTVNTVTAVNPVPYNNYEIRFFPNPASSILFIDSLKLSDKWQSLDIIAMDGKKMISSINLVNKTKLEIPIAKLLPGEYITVLTRKTGAKTFFTFIKM